MFYVYEVQIVSTGEIVYVGKGTGNRYRARKKNNLLNRIISENECKYVITAQYNTEEEAFEAERQRINELKGFGQAVCNKITERTGGLANWTDERRKLMSEHNPMKTPEQRRRMSERNPMKNSEVAKSVGEKHRLNFAIGEKEYSGLTSAAEEYGVTIQAIAYWLERGYAKDGKKCFRIVQSNSVSIPLQSVANMHVVIFDGKEYPSIKEAADAAGCSPCTLRAWTKRGFSPMGKVCRYKDDTTDYQYVNLKSANSSVKRAVVVNGIRYESIVAASRATGYNVKRLDYYLNRAKNPPVQCNYVNQQPSGANFDNSNSEGSTTNG